MKKLLALVLALVMTMSLVTISNAAFSDAADIDYKEAVDVLAAVGVLEGSDGKFDPKAELTREQAAKIIAYLDLGKSTAEALPAVKVFNDVEASRWSAKFIAYCADAGYINGVGNGNFDPTGKLTGYAFGKLLLCALGYDATIEEMTGANWTIKVAKLMEKNSISKGTSKLGSAVLTREEAAQYALNALKATMVEYDSKGTSIEINGAKIATGASSAKAVKVAVGAVANYANAISHDYTAPGDYTVELGEKLYKGDLTYGVSATTTDDFGRAQVTWAYKVKDVAAHASDAVVTYSADMTGAAGLKQIAADLKGYKFNGTEIKTKDTTDTAGATVGALTVAASGKIVDAIAALTANGKAVEVYANSTTKAIINVVVIAYTVEKITNVTTNKDGDVTYSLSVSGAKVDYADDYAKDDTVVLHGTFAKNDYVTTVVGTNSTDLHVYPTTKVVGTQTATDGTNLTISGTKYKLGKGVTGYNGYTYTNSSKDANYFLDQFGFVVASSDVETELVYAVVNKIAAKNTTTGLSTGKSAEAELVFTDGTKSTVKIAKINGIKVANFTVTTDTSTDDVTWGSSAVTAVSLSDQADKNVNTTGKIVSYVIDSDGKYELTYAKTPTSTTATTGNALTNKGVPAFGTGSSAKSGTSATVYVVKTKNSSGDDVFKSYTGFTSVPTIEANGGTLTAYYVTKSDKVAFVYIDASATADVGEKTTDNLFYVTGTTVTTNGTASDGYVYTLTGILDGAKTTIESKVTDFKVASGSMMTKGAFYTLSINEDGYVTAATAEAFTDSNEAKGTADQALIDSLENGTFGGYLTDSATKVYVINDGDASEGSAESIAIGDAWYVILKSTGTAAEKNTIKTLYIVVA